MISKEEAKEMLERAKQEMFACGVGVGIVAGSVLVAIIVLVMRTIGVG